MPFIDSLIFSEEKQRTIKYVVYFIKKKTERKKGKRKIDERFRVKRSFAINEWLDYATFSSST